MVKFTKKQIDFINTEAGKILLPSADSVTDPKKLRKIFSMCCNIEEIESIKHLDEEMSERGDMAIEIVELIFSSERGNQI